VFRFRRVPPKLGHQLTIGVPQMLKKFTLIAALAVSTAPAFAGNQVLDLSSGTASFAATGPVLDGGQDTLSFVNLAAGTYDFLLSIAGQNITGMTATLNGQAATITLQGKISFAGLEGTSASPFNLAITGLAGAKATYSGDLTVTPSVPEPETYAMLLAGLGAIGFMARRRLPGNQA
jgi:hypothetical protein